MIALQRGEIVWLCVALGAIALVLVWFSLMMAAAESAVARVTRSSLNNRILDVQTSAESRFVALKQLNRIHIVQRLIIDRYATASSCAFARIVCNVLDGVLVSLICTLLDAPLWAVVLAGVLSALCIGVVSVLVRPRANGESKPLDIMLRQARVVSVVCLLTPFAKITGHAAAWAKTGKTTASLSEDEELERIHREQGKAAIDRLVEAGDFDKEVSEMMRNVLTLSDTLTREIMVPRTDMICIAQDATLEQVLRMFSRSGFSRVPVIGESVDDLVGMVYLKDAVKAVAFNAEANARSVTSIVREPLLVPESKPVDDLFHQMQRQRQHAAIVVDEYGGIAGLVTIEDAIEQIVGELEDEHDRTQRQEPVQLGPGQWQFPARAPIADVEDAFEITIDEDDVDTVYGLLTKLLGRVPIVGSSAQGHGLRFTAVDSAGRRKKVSTVLVESLQAQRSNEDSE